MTARRETSLDIDIGAQVRTVDGGAVGRVTGVVVEPDREAVTHLIVRWDDLFAVDKVVPVDEIAAVTDHRVTLRLLAAEVVDLPGFDERAYVPLREGAPPEESAAATTTWISATPIALPALAAEPARAPFIVEEWRNVPENSVLLREGLPVHAWGGEDVGTVDELVVDPQTGAITHLVVRWVEDPRRDKAIPVEWVGRSDEEKGVLLLVDRSTVAELPDYHTK